MRHVRRRCRHVRRGVCARRVRCRRLRAIRTDRMQAGSRQNTSAAPLALHYYQGTDYRGVSRDIGGGPRGVHLACGEEPRHADKGDQGLWVLYRRARTGPYMALAYDGASFWRAYEFGPGRLRLGARGCAHSGKRGVVACASSSRSPSPEARLVWGCGGASVSHLACLRGNRCACGGVLRPVHGSFLLDVALLVRR